jgi:hypothetical protein
MATCDRVTVALPLCIYTDGRVGGAIESICTPLFSGAIVYPARPSVASKRSGRRGARYDLPTP